MKMVVVALLVCGWTLSALAKTDCPKLISDLHEMQKAQQSMMKSFVNKNETIADALEHMAQDRRNLSSLTLKRSAQTFRQHQAREAKLVNRFETASDQLLDQVEQCLMEGARLSANK